MSRSDGEDAVDRAADQTMFDRLEKDLSAVKSDISTLTEQITDALNTFAEGAGKQARRSYRQARDNVDQMASEASDRGGAAMDAAYEAAHSLEETLEDAIRQRPIAAVGLALGLGFLIGVTWRR